MASPNRRLAQTPFWGVCDVPKGHPSVVLLFSPSIDRFYSIPACRLTVASTARANCNSLPPAPTAEPKCFAPRASVMISSSGSRIR